jgi:hypothetical protein
LCGKLCSLTRAGDILVILFLFGFQSQPGTHFTFRRAKVR